ncbi:CPBP family intramembrane glutamic endopeptidase [Virgibacillus halodenitrificans]
MNNINAAIDGKLLWIVFPLLISPIIEELVFRKWIPNAFQESIGRKGSILFSNILFAFFHFDLYFLPYLFNGLIYSYFYDKTKDIKVPIVIHIIYNFIVFLLTFICR